jgi:hypothetical protein
MKLVSNLPLDTPLHPICLLSSTDAQTSSLYYSFFIITSEDEKNGPKVLFRVPSQRDRLDDVESAVKYFVSFSVTIGEEDSFGTFVITTSDGSRYFAVWRASEAYLLVAV